MPEKEKRASTRGRKKTHQDHQALPSGGKADQFVLTLTRTMGIGTGELVDKIDWEVGDIIDGRFEVTAIIGWGGMGVVYKVHHLEWNLDLAVKMPLTYLVADAGSKARFIREAQTWVDLGLHPNIVQCWYVRELGGIPRVFMDYLEGGSLKDWISKGKVRPGEWDRILDLMIQACDGLGYAYEHGVTVHRDVKPGNLLLTESGELRVTDFGIVKHEGIADIVGKTSGKFSNVSQGTITVTGSELGTPEYGAPEQWGEAKHADARADIYALGVILFELCCGRRPFDDGISREAAHVLIGRHLSSPAPDPKSFHAEMPNDLAEIILQCLAKEPGKRPESMTVLREMLSRVYDKVVGKIYRRPVPQAGELRSDTLNNRAVSLLDLGKKTEALNVWKEALKLDAYHPESVYNTALLEWIEGAIADDEVVRRLEAIKDHSKRAHFYLGLVHLERAAADEAEKELTEALNESEFASNNSIWRALGDAQMAQEKYAEAEKAYQKAQEIVSGDFGSLEGQTLAQIKTRQQGDQILFPWLHCCRVFEGGHANEVTTVAATPDGRFVVSGSRDSTLRLWDLATAECLRTYDRYRTEITSVAVTLNGRFLISGSDDGTLCLWDFATAESLRIFEGHKQDVTAVAVTPDGRFVVSGSHDHTLRLWDLATAQCLRTFEGHQAGVTAIAFSPNGRFIVSGSEDRTLGLWDLATAKRLQTFRGHKERVTAVAVAPNGNLAVSGSVDGTLRLWKLVTAKCLRTFNDHKGGVTAVAITPDGCFFVSGSEDKTLRLWNLETLGQRQETTIQVCRQRKLGELQLSTDRFRKRMSLAKTAWEKRKVATAYRYLTQARAIPGYERAPESLAFNALLGKVFPRKRLRGEWLLWNFEGHSGGVTAVAVTPDGCFVVSGSEDNTLRLWELATAKCLRTFEGHAASITAVAITPDGRFVVSGSEDKTLRLWDLKTAKCLRIYEGHKLSVTAVTVPPYGQFLVSGSKDRTLRLWNPATAKCIQTFEGQEQGITTVAVTPDGRFIVSGNSGRNLLLWDRPTGKCLFTFEGHKKSVTAVSVTPNSQFALSGSKDKTLRLWDLISGECLWTSQDHEDGVTSIAMTPDARFAISGSKDKTLRLWNCTTGECVWIFKGHRLGVTAVVITPDGRFVVSGSEDKTLKVWELDWELDTNETARPGTGENGKSTRLLNRITSLLDNPRKK